MAMLLRDRARKPLAENSELYVNRRVVYTTEGLRVIVGIPPQFELSLTAREALALASKLIAAALAMMGDDK